jgi:heme A synthase
MGLSPRPRVAVPSRPTSSRTFRLLAGASAVWGFATVLLGADVTFTGSALACPAWPLCGAGGVAALIETTHRAAALILSALILFLFFAAVVSRRTPSGMRYLSAIAFLLVVAQALVGGAIIEFSASPNIVILHLGLAVLLVAVLSVLAVFANFASLPPRWQRALLSTEPSLTEPAGSVSPSSTPGGAPARSARP